MYRQNPTASSPHHQQQQQHHYAAMPPPGYAGGYPMQAPPVMMMPHQGPHQYQHQIVMPMMQHQQHHYQQQPPMMMPHQRGPAAAMLPPTYGLTNNGNKTPTARQPSSHQQQQPMMGGGAPTVRMSHPNTATATPAASAPPPRYGSAAAGPSPTLAVAATPTVSVVPFVVPALTPALQSNMAVIKPSHQILIVKPLPAFLTEDEDLLSLAKTFVLPDGYAEAQAKAADRILAEGNAVVMEKINAITTTAGSSSSGSVMKQLPTTTNNSDANSSNNHCNYLPFAAKVIRKSVLSAITAAFHARRAAAAASADDQEELLANAIEEAGTDACGGDEVIANKDCFCEEGYGFLLFASEEAGLKYLRAVEHLALGGAVAEDGNDDGDVDANKPHNISRVQQDYNAIDAIKRRVYAEDNETPAADDDEDVMNASFSSSVSSSSCDSATSFDSNSSFASVASEIDDDADESTAQQINAGAKTAGKNNNNSNACVLRDCNECAQNRRKYRIYYRAKMNRQQVDSVRVRCAVIVAEQQQEKKDNTMASSTATNKRPLMFNGIPAPSKEHIAEMRSHFKKCFFRTTVSVAGGDGTVAAKGRVKSVPLATSPATSSTGPTSSSTIVSALAAAPLEKRTVAVQRPIIIDCDGREVTFARGTPSMPVRTHFVMHTTADNLPKLTADLLRQHQQQHASSSSADNHSYSVHDPHHHTHHRHCVAHRAMAVAKRVEVRRAKTVQAKLCSRAKQAPHVVSISIPATTATNTTVAAPIKINTANVGVGASSPTTITTMSKKATTTALPPAYGSATAAPLAKKKDVTPAASITTPVDAEVAQLTSSDNHQQQMVIATTTTTSSNAAPTPSYGADDEACGSSSNVTYNYGGAHEDAMGASDNTTNTNNSHSATAVVEEAVATTASAKVNAIPAPRAIVTVLAHNGQARYCHNPYGMPQPQPKQQRKHHATMPAAQQFTSVITSSSAAVAKPMGSEAVSAARPIQQQVVSSGSQQPALPHQHHHNSNAGGLAAFLPQWATANAAGGLQDAANNASARLRNMLSLNKAKRF